MYDVIVIGAGPAGCSAAKVLSQKGKKVLLVEKFKLPRQKSCSGVLIKKSMELIKHYFGESVPEYTMCAPVKNKGMIFTDDKGKEYRFEQEGLNITRSKLDHWLVMKASGYGVEIRDGVSAVDCEEKYDCVEVTLKDTKTYTEKAKYVINCEGVVGAIKRKLTDCNKDYITTFQTFNEGSIDLDPHYFYAYLQPELSEYDAWFNVKDNLLIFGVAVKDANKIHTYYERFISYMIENHNLRINKQLTSEKWLMPHIQPGCQIDYGKKSIFFAGEIAGFLNPMGEGISAALESGYAIANAVANNFENPQAVLGEYINNTKALKFYMQRQWNFVAQISDKFLAYK